MWKNGDKVIPTFTTNGVVVFTFKGPYLDLKGEPFTVHNFAVHMARAGVKTVIGRLHSGEGEYKCLLSYEDADRLSAYLIKEGVMKEG